MNSMKKIILLIIFAVGALYGVGVSQNYVPIQESGVTWRVDKVSCVYCTADFVTCTCSKFQYTLQGDTTVGSYTYKKIHREWQDIDEFEVTDSGYVGALRQEINNKRAYYLIPNTTIDTLLYDFNLSIGDTLPPSYIHEASNSIIVEIDSILLGYNYHKTYRIGNISHTLIEGIGSTAGLLESLQFFEVSYHLKCFSLSSGYHHVFDGSNDCDIITNIPQTEKINIQISPNPATETLIIKGDTPARITLCNTIGQTVAEFVNTNQINVGALANGIYVLQLYDINGELLKSEKVVKE